MAPYARVERSDVEDECPSLPPFEALRSIAAACMEEAAREAAIRKERDFDQIPFRRSTKRKSTSPYAYSNMKRSQSPEQPSASLDRLPSFSVPSSSQPTSESEDESGFVPSSSVKRARYDDCSSFDSLSDSASSSPMAALCNAPAYLEHQASPSSSPHRVPSISAPSSPTRTTPTSSKKRKGGSHDLARRDAEFCFEELKKLFHLPLAKAAKIKGVCETVFKRLCRENGIPRWPHRTVRSIERKLGDLGQVRAQLSEIHDPSDLMISDANLQIMRLEELKRAIYASPKSLQQVLVK